MRRQLDTKSSLLLKRKIESEGVKVYLNTSIDSILGEESVTGIKVNENYQINCDSIVYSIGVTPNTTLVQDTAIKLNRGIVVDEKMRTNIESVYAAGDVAEINDEIEGLWATAMEQGRVAGSNMVSKTAIYKKKFQLLFLTHSMYLYFQLDQLMKSNVIQQLLKKMVRRSIQGYLLRIIK